MKKKELSKESRRAGFYWIEDMPYASVTHILRCIDKPSLRYWYGKQVFLAMAKDPTLDESQALAMPYQRREEAKSRGQTIHSIIEAYKKEGIILKDIPEKFHGFAKAFYSWIKDNNIDILSQEKTIVSNKYRYAGTLDLLVKMNGNSDVWIVDVKTGNAIYPETTLQLSAYKHAYEETGGKVDRIAALLLQEGGQYKFEICQPDIEVFLACQKLWTWMNKDLCKEVGY